MKKLCFLVFSITLFFLSSCNKEDEEKDYTYSINRVYWSDSLDSNADNFFQFMRLNFIVQLEEEVNRTTVAEIYYRPKNASEFSFYGFSDFYEIKGSSVDNEMSMDIGLPNKELKRGYYDFMIELYEKGNNRLEAKSDSAQNEIMANKAFDKASRDKSYMIDVSWSNFDDRDQDGYARNAVLEVDIDVLADVTKELELEVYLKRVEDSVYTLYHSIDTISITGSTTDDIVITDIGIYRTELELGEYDFRLELFEKGSDILIKFIDEKTDNLAGRKFERQSDDSFEYSVTNIFWSDTTDTDKDGFTFKRKLHFDVNVDSDINRELFAKIFVRPQDSTDYRIYDSIGVFNITGSQNDNIIMPIGNATAVLDSNLYDLLVSVFETSEFDTILAISFPIEEDTLIFEDQKFETESQDSL